MSRVLDPVSVLQNLIRCPSVTPKEGGALDVLQTHCEEIGFTGVERPVFSADGTPDIENFYARLGNANGPHLMFAGHTDVVPVGDKTQWHYGPFSGTIFDDVMYGRGAVDMKGGIACFIAALSRYLEKNPLSGSVSLLITGDEEGPSINGTVKLLQWAQKKGEKWDAALVGEPTSVEKLGDIIKVGRRGSLSGILHVNGKQGHVAYPTRAANPIPELLKLLQSLLNLPLDLGTDRFQPSNLEVTALETGNPVVNVIPGTSRAFFNVRYNDLWSAETLKQEIENKLAQAAKVINTMQDKLLSYELEWLKTSGEAFMTHDEKLIGTLMRSIKQHSDLQPELSTSGGTSDARFIKDYCPVVEMGLVGTTMHMANECVPLQELEQLTQIYETFIKNFFSDQAEKSRLSSILRWSA